MTFQLHKFIPWALIVVHTVSLDNGLEYNKRHAIMMANFIHTYMPHQADMVSSPVSSYSALNFNLNRTRHVIHEVSTQILDWIWKLLVFLCYMTGTFNSQ